VTVEGAKVELHMPDQQLYGVPGQVLVAPSGSASKLMCWPDRDRIIAELTAGITDLSGAIPSAERPGRMRELEERLFRLEVAEEFFVTEAIAAGLEAHRRPDASPWAILGWGLQPPEAPVAEAAE
jgi:hypothetical protein